MKKFLPLFIFILIGTFSYGQFGNFGSSPQIKGKISGSIIDTMTNQSVGFATISLKRSGRDKILNGTLSDESGGFAFTEINPGTYDLEISFLGYSTKLIAKVETTKKDPDYNVGNIFLVPTDYLLEEVQITEKRALFENKVDRIVFNAEDDASISGGDATDVLRKVPNLSVDLDGNVSIRGSQNVRILINGKPSGMFSSNVADALKMFPADEIKRVEVITSPGAKYDAEGSGGIINIVTKKKNVEGVAGSINTSVGNRSSNAFANLNAGKGRFGSTFNGSIFYSLPQDGTFSFERIDQTPDGERVLTQDGITETSRLGWRGSASAFYDVNAYNSFNTSLNYRGFGFDSDGVYNGQLIDPRGLAGFSFERRQVGDNIFDGFDWNTDYTRTFEKNEGQELVLAYQLSRNNQDQEFDVIETNSFSAFNRDENIFNDSDNWESTFQVDYTHPFPKSIKLEIGGKGVIRDIDSDYKYSILNEATQMYDLDVSRSNVFNYDQDVLAGYAQLNFVIGKFQFISGLRYEHTDIGGLFDKGEFDFDNDYDNWIPNFTVSRSLSNFRTLKLGYTKRIQRPSLFNVNPFVNNADRTNLVIGNPLLDPELTHQIELSYNTRILGFNIFASSYYKRTNDIIEQILVINENGVSVNTFDNVGTNNSVGINMFINKSINKFNIRFGGDVFTYDATGVVNGENLSNTDINYQIFTNGEYTISGSFKADFFGFFRSNQSTLQGFTPSFSIFGIGFRKDWKDLSIGIRIIEPFSENKAFNTNQSGANFSQVSGFTIPFRSIGVNLRYKFGKVDFRERRSKIRNDDVKSGGDQQNQQGGQQGGVGS